MAERYTILIADDERHTREGLKEALCDDYEVLLAEDGTVAFRILTEKHVDIVLTDLRMPGLDGMAFTRQAMSLPNPPFIIMLTAYGSIQTAVEALKVGAYDYISKPVDLDNLDVMLKRCVGELEKRRESAVSSENGEVIAGIIGHSAGMNSVMERVRQVAVGRATVLVTGESGTGKELVAHALHQLSNRADKPFVAVHCASLSENLLEAELFGHEKGAFTGAVERVAGRFELADGGTLFLDEIGEISPATQVKLLRVLETRQFERVGGTKTLTVDVRVVAATNRDLKQMAEQGTFREDLFYRLNVVNICIPPLRERIDDIPEILEYYVKKSAADNGRHVTGISPDAVKMLCAYRWPGNVRELRNTVERMVVFAGGEVLTINDVPVELRRALEEQFATDATAHEGSTSPVDAVPKGELDVHANEKALILQALEECGGNRSRAAEKLNISRRTLQRKLKEYGVQ